MVASLLSRIKLNQPLLPAGVSIFYVTVLLFYVSVLLVLRVCNFIEVTLGFFLTECFCLGFCEHVKGVCEVFVRYHNRLI